MAVAQGKGAESAEASRPNYSRPPVMEVVVGIGVVPSRKFRVDSLQNVVRGTADGFPVRQQNTEVQLQAQARVGRPPEASINAKPAGYRWVDQEGGRVIVMEAAKFSFSKLRPYSRWEDVRDESRRWWAKFVSAARPISINRIGLRYINRIDLPLPSGELGEYFLTRLDVADGLPSTVATWTFEIGIEQQDLANTMVYLRQARVEPDRPDMAAVIFDIDVLKGMQLDNNFDSIWGQFETLHNRASAYFERSITQRVRDLFA